MGAEGVIVGADDLVWYVSYGSNLNLARFLAYLQGGRVPGNDVDHAGCTDPAPPRNDVAMELNHSLYFAGWSKRWGGTSAAFVSLSVPDPPCLARAYLITQGQFVDVVRQENRLQADIPDFDQRLHVAKEHGHARLLPTGFYAELLFCGERDGHPMLTFTASDDRTDVGRPSAPYLQMIGSGLRECHGVATAQAVTYLIGRPGVQGTWTRRDLQDLLEVRDGDAATSPED
jgi:hypothetical protein